MRTRPTLNFNLRNKNEKRTFIRVVFRYSKLEIKLQTTKELGVKFWDFSKQRAKKTSMMDSDRLNTYLNSLENKIFSAFNEYVEAGTQPSKSQMERVIETLIHGKQVETASFIEFSKDFISRSSIAKLTRKNYLATVSKVEQFNPELSFQDVDLKFYDNFKKFCHKKGNGRSVFGKNIKHIKMLMQEAYEEQLHTNMVFLSNKFKVLKEEGENEVLSPEELDRLYETDVPEGLQHTKDIFLIACWTGLRFSDATRLDKDRFINRDDKWFVVIRTRKTLEPIVCPLNSKCIEIIERYNFNLGKLSNQKFNKNLKKICMLADIDEPVYVFKTDLMGNKKETKHAKYELITSHSARRSFATNCEDAGIDRRAIMLITGHKTETEFLRYIKTKPKKNARTLSQHPFFQ